MIGWRPAAVLAPDAHGRSIGSGFYNANAAGPNDPGHEINDAKSANMRHPPSCACADIPARYKIAHGGTRALPIFGGVDNLFTAPPPLDPGPRGTGTAILFDPAGQTFKLGVRLRY